MDEHGGERENGFAKLSPEGVLNAVEHHLGYYFSNLCRPLNSYINRVYEVEDEDNEPFIVKFYRPGRWSREALEEEHAFTVELTENEIPAIAPLKLQNDSTLGEWEGFYFSIFPKRGGRFVDELNEDQWILLGRLLGRMHMVGAASRFQYRPVISPDKSLSENLKFIVDSGLLAAEVRQQYIDTVEQLIAEASPLFASTELIRIHGDCHSGNLIYRPDESYMLIDLDDMAMGPPVQDFWMLLPGDREHAGVEISLFLEGYETFRSFDWRSLALIEPLRAMRFVHYTAWCAHQVLDDGQTLIIPDFGSYGYWARELNDLRDQLQTMAGKTEGEEGLYW